MNDERANKKIEQEIEKEIEEKELKIRKKRKRRGKLKFHFKKSFLIPVLIFTALLSIGLISMNDSVYAKKNESSKYYSHLNDSEIEDIFGLKVGEIANPWAWITEAKTFVIVEENNGNYTYWWNTPNIQMSAQNSLYDAIISSGYGTHNGREANKDQWLVDLGETKNANTAMKKYGFHLANPTYTGERPLITISVADVLIPDDFFDGVGRVWDLFTGGKVVPCPTNEDLNSLIYVCPHDYDTSAITFEHWVEKNWDKVVKKLDKHQVLISGTKNDQGEDTGLKDGKYYVFENLTATGKKEGQTVAKEGVDAKTVCQTLKENSGKYYPEVAKNIILASGLGQTHQTERIMPYDTSRMSEKDKKMFSVSDPRSEMQNSLLSTGYDKELSAIFKKATVSVSAKLAEITVALNSFSNFSFVDNVGLDVMALWNPNIVMFLTWIIIILFCVFCIKSAIEIIRTGGARFSLFLKIISTFFIALSIYCVGSNPDNTYKQVKNISTNIFNLANVAFERQDSVNALYGTGDAADKENTELWLPYFNIWTSYHTNHSILDKEQNIDTSSKNVEYKNLIVPTLEDGTKQTLWSTVLADAVVTNTNYSGNIYRMVDHFMAPRLKQAINDKDEIDVKVAKNENYNGNIQSSLNLSQLCFQLLIFFFVVLKVLIFFEFLLNISMLLFNMALLATNMFRLKRVLKELGASMLDVVFMNVFIGLAVWGSLAVSGLFGFAIFIFFVYLTVAIIKTLARSNSVFTPKIFKPITQACYKISDAFK